MKPLYYYMENLGLNDSQRDTLKDWFMAFNDSTSPRPNFNMHIRVRLDNQAVIFEAMIDENKLTKEFVLDKLANIFEVDPATVTVNVLNSPYGEGVDFERPAGTKRLRFGVFGGRDATWEESREQALAYLSANIEEWNGL